MQFFINIDRTDTTFGRTDWQAFARSIEQGNYEFTLDLKRSSIEDNDLPILAELLERSFGLAKITVVDLSHNDISDKGTIYLAGKLKDFPTLLALNLSSNRRIGDEGAKGLVRAFASPCSLQTLFVSDCSISREQILRLEQAGELRHKKNLLPVYVSNNHHAWIERVGLAKRGGKQPNNQIPARY